mmetsp:Transcript_92844/g.194045  ORF Transcript_92844/g.194045 Transcript_92844/m.194045 type:complete len:848 (-) Transcript_92844:81-2624(-)|eukprot:CAMPEP_0206473212 /NCGR_PEP_ID=MMETSP0324_2-20121206/32710_1 /ASSEMBLY_ACC=CAM_ASM_000836 /TAXON_ID=2866 /ORGANISM="Crypthecodinium cohnii, Strain Seligo" /LENGTH=847 /DNA_ID=CAMNT_0053948057 /DNA_START=56 /DNA_END=2599 /DNA_ORIENTATION=+
MRALVAGSRRRLLSSLGRARHVGAASQRFFASESSLAAASKKLRQRFNSLPAIAEIAKEADAPIDRKVALKRLTSELAEGETILEVKLGGKKLEPGDGRKEISVPTPTGPKGGPAVKHAKMVLPSVADVATALKERKEAHLLVAKAEDMVPILRKFYEEQFIGKAAEHVGLISAWGPKPIGDAEGEFGEVAALMRLQLEAIEGAIESSKDDFHFVPAWSDVGRECLVMPPSNFALLGLKDVFHMLLKGFRVVLVVQPRFLAHFLEVQQGFLDAGLPEGMLEVIPGITPEADPEVLFELLKQVDRLQFTGSSAMFKSLVKKAYELGNLRLEHAGEVSGLNKVRLDGVSVSHPAVARGTAWAAMANNGELCTSASLVEFDPKLDTKEAVKEALEAHPFKLGRDPEDESLNVLLKDGKTDKLKVETETPPGGLQEWWEKTILTAPSGGDLSLRTNQSLGHCIYSKTFEAALEKGVSEDASCVYCVGVPADPSAPSARAGTTGAKIPESVFGGMKTHTFAVAGDHDGVGCIQNTLDVLKWRGPTWRDREEPYAEYELTETAEDLMDFLGTREQAEFQKTLNRYLDFFGTFTPEVSNPYPGQPLVNGEGRSQLVTLPALKPTRKNVFVPRGIGLPDDIVRLAILAEMSPLKEVPVTIHLPGAKLAGKLRITDPLKSFVKTVEKRLGWKVIFHEDHEKFVEAIKESEYPPYFYCVKHRHHLPVEMLDAVAERGGYVYEGLPRDPVRLLQFMTTTQAWTVAALDSEVEAASKALHSAWKSHGLREEPLEKPQIVTPPPPADLGGGFGAPGMGLGDDKDWDELSDSSSDSSDDEADPKKPPTSPASSASTAAPKA